MMGEAIGLYLKANWNCTQRWLVGSGARELPATLQRCFHVANQEVGESLDDWLDRALTLATTAFCDLPFAYTAEQAVTEVLSRFA